MKKIKLLLALSLISFFNLSAENRIVVSNFENVNENYDTGSTAYTTWGGTAGKSTVELVANPQIAGLNTSAHVLKVITSNATDAAIYFRNLAVTVTSDGNRYFHCKLLKQEGSKILVGTTVGGVSKLPLEVQNTGSSDWQEFTVNMLNNSAQDWGVQEGATITKIAFQAYKTASGITYPVTYYIDDIYFSDSETPTPPVDFVIDADGEKASSQYGLQGMGIYGDIIVNSDDTSAGQLTIPENGLQVNGKVIVKKTFEVEQWYPMGFPFDIDMDNIMGDFATNPKLYLHNPNGTQWGDFWVKSYDGSDFVYETAIIAASTGYIFQFPAAFEDREVTFASTSNPVLKNLTEADLTVTSTYTLLANPSVKNLELDAANDAGNHYYIYDRAENSFVLLTSGTAIIKPFESFVAVTGIEESALRSALNIDVATGLIPAFMDDSKDPVIKTQYYTLQGMEIIQPLNHGVYIVKKMRASHKVETSKIIYQKDKVK
jgi:hypothetical protein